MSKRLPDEEIAAIEEAFKNACPDSAVHVLLREVKRLRDRETLFWKIMRDNPLPNTALVTLVKDLRNAMLCGGDGMVFCYTLGGLLRDHLEGEPCGSS